MTPKNRVIVDVVGGVANPWKIPEGVEVEIRDYDNGEVAPPGEFSRDKNGGRFCRGVYSWGDCR